MVLPSSIDSCLSERMLSSSCDALSCWITLSSCLSSPPRSIEIQFLLLMKAVVVGVVRCIGIDENGNTRLYRRLLLPPAALMLMSTDANPTSVIDDRIDIILKL